MRSIFTVLLILAFCLGMSAAQQTCAVASDCTGALPALCEVCSDGTSGCAHYVCNNGQCQIEYCPPEPGHAPPVCQPACQPGYRCDHTTSPPSCYQFCLSASDCTGPLPMAPCRLNGCPDGSTWCPHWTCPKHRCTIAYCD